MFSVTLDFYQFPLEVEDNAFFLEGWGAEGLFVHLTLRLLRIRLGMPNLSSSSENILPL